MSRRGSDSPEFQERRVLGSFRAGRDVVRVQTVRVRGRLYLDVRRFAYGPDGEIPTKRGIMIGYTQLEDLCACLDDERRQLRRDRHRDAGAVVTFPTSEER